MLSLPTDYIINAPSRDLSLKLAAGEQRRLVVISLQESADYHIAVDLTGADSRVEIYGLSMGGAIHTEVRHLVPDTSSQQLVKFILPAEKHGSFFGQLYIAPDAQRTDAGQVNRNLLLDPSATMSTKPQLEIYADDVRAGHGASTGMLDLSALYYMAQRCIDPVTAKKLLIGAFAAEVLDGMEDTALRDSVATEFDEVLQRLTI